MTKTMEWLKARAPAFDHLSSREQSAIADFPLLWSLFENRILGTEGNAGNICAAADAWSQAGTLDAAVVDPELAYFRDRYYAAGAFTYHFDSLHLRGNRDREPLVRAVIDGSDNDERRRVTAVLIIVFRYRNNLFHGVKWQYKLEGQLGNFTAANNALMKVRNVSTTLIQPGLEFKLFCSALVRWLCRLVACCLPAVAHGPQGRVGRRAWFPHSVT